MSLASQDDLDRDMTDWNSIEQLAPRQNQNAFLRYLGGEDSRTFSFRCGHLGLPRAADNVDFEPTSLTALRVSGEPPSQSAEVIRSENQDASPVQAKTSSWPMTERPAGHLSCRGR